MAVLEPVKLPRSLLAIIAVPALAGVLLSTGLAMASDSSPSNGTRAGGRSITLLTGDVVHLGARDTDPVSVSPAAGREQMRFVSRLAGGHREVIPMDAVPMVESGRLDRRLFDVTALTEFGYDSRHGSLPLIVASSGPAGAQAAMRADARSAGLTVTKDLPAVHGYAFNAPHADAASRWAGLTDKAGSTRTLKQAFARIWLDAKVKPLDDVTTPLVGAPQAWSQGFTGKGVPIAIIDTGIDDTHPDLAGKVLAARDFTGDGDTLDRAGHGTQVASIAVGTGAASDGRYAGVAKGADLYSAKVCTPVNGCPESAVIEGMQWVAGTLHARVANVSIGGSDGPELDPMSAAVNTLTAEYGTLFVAASGNIGEQSPVDSPGTVSSPAKADAALAVGGTSHTGDFVAWSGRGPRAGDFAIKPDISAPGEDVIGAFGKDSEENTPIGPGGRYTSGSGTSLASPHVAGAAAILAQQHPAWVAAQLKAALMAAAKPNPTSTIWAEGAGLLDVGRAVRQAVTTTPPSASFGLFSWPRSATAPVTKTITYDNYADKSITLHLDLHTETDVPGLFRLSTQQLTVPAGGRSAVTVTVDARGTMRSGHVGGEIVATAGDVAVRTPVGAELETESYNLTVTYLDRSGNPASNYTSEIAGPDGQIQPLYDAAGTARVRLPKGDYTLDAVLFDADGTSTLAVQPLVRIDHDQTLKVDARAGKPVSVTSPRSGATQVYGTIGFWDAQTSSGTSVSGPDFRGIATVGLRSPSPPRGFITNVTSDWNRGTDTFHLSWFVPGSFPTGYRRAVDSHSLAAVDTTIAAEADGGQGQVTFGSVDRDSIAVFSGLAGPPHPLPFRQRAYVNTDDGVRWYTGFDQIVPGTDPGGRPGPVSSTYTPYVRYLPGRTYPLRLNEAVFGPALGTDGGTAIRDGDQLSIGPNLYTDARGNNVAVSASDATTTVVQDGVKISEGPGAFAFPVVPAEPHVYQVTFDSRRAAPFVLSTRTTLSWTFRSGHTGSRTTLPVSLVRFTPTLDARNTAPAGRDFTFPFHLERTAGPVQVLMQVSYDDGQTWLPVPIRQKGDDGVARVHHPTGHGFTSLRTTLTDADGNTTNQTIIRAYRY